MLPRNIQYDLEICDFSLRFEPDIIGIESNCFAILASPPYLECNEYLHLKLKAIQLFIFKFTLEFQVTPSAPRYSTCGIFDMLKTEK